MTSTTRDGDGPWTVGSWLRATDWLWMIIGGFYQLAYLFWYIPALSRLPRSVRDPPGQFPWHWPLDFTATAVSGGVLLLLGFQRATSLSTGSRDAEREIPRTPGAPREGDS